MQSISIDILHHPPRPDTATLRVHGFVYANTLAQLEKAVQSAFEAHKKNLVFDLTDTNYVSSGGWSFLLSSAKRAQKLGGELLLAGMRAEVYDAFELLEYDKILRLFTTPEKAMTEGLAQALNGGG